MKWRWRMDGGKEGGREKCVGEREEIGEREEADFMGPPLHSTADQSRLTGKQRNSAAAEAPTDACFGKV